jgi:succinate dehydrogenase/fumarate reductase flavoprotein subunit
MSVETALATQIDCDLLIIGSGAGGLSAAVTAAWHGLKVIVTEKEAVLGGTTAWSGGWMWTPRNPLAQRAGIVEDPEAPRAYLRNVLGNNFNEAKVDAFREGAPHMVAFFENNTAVQFELGLKIPDTYGNAPGAGTGGRSVIAAPYEHTSWAVSSSVCASPCARQRSLALPYRPGRTLQRL